MEIRTIVLSTAVKTTVATIVLTAIATIAGLVAQFTEAAAFVAVGLIAKANVNTKPGT